MRSNTKILDWACKVWGFRNATIDRKRKVNDAEIQCAIEETELRVAGGASEAIEMRGDYMVTSWRSGDMVMTCISDVRIYRGVKLEKAGKFEVEGL